MASIVDMEVDELRGVPVARISGEVDMSVTTTLGDRLEAALVDGGKGLVLDLSGVSFLDSSGLRMLLDTASGLKRRGQALRLVVPQRSFVANLLAVSGAGDILPADPTVPAALEQLAPAD